MPEIYATAHFTQYGQYDKAYTQRKRFVEEIDSQDGACTTETKTYWKSVNDWRTLLVTIPYEERQEIIFEYLDFHLLEDNEAETLLDAFNRLDPFIAAVSKRALIDFFENNALEHATRASVNKHQSKFGLLIAGLGGDILKHEQDMFRKTKCPSMFWKETRLELMEEECEKFGHSSRCKTYIKDGECSWLDRETKKSLKIGMQRKNWFADNKRMENLKLKATGYYIEELKKDPKFNF